MTWWLLSYLAVGWLIRVGMVLVILRRELPPGTSLAWLGIIFLHPYIGATLYSLIGQSQLGLRRARQHKAVAQEIRSQPRDEGRARHTIEPDIDAAYAPMVRQARRICGLPVLSGNSVDFIDDAKQMVDQLVADIDAAKSHAHLLYYIFAPDDPGNRVVNALIAAAGRGVKCRVLADAIGSRALLGRHGPAKKMAAAGVEVHAALPAAPLRRRDLRNHRKLAIIDDTIAFVGSHNLIDPYYGGKRGGPWCDVTGRFTGPVVSELGTVFIEDWAFETGRTLELPATPETPAHHGINAQVVPTGPGKPGDTFRRVLLAALQSAQKKVTLTTPYFVPDETTMTNLMMATDRGVDINLILPARCDQILPAAAGRAHYTALLEAGVRIFEYQPGLIHAKTTTVDDAFAILGSANLDIRSFTLNFELSVLLYGPEVTQRLRAVQEKYLTHSKQLDRAAWLKRPLTLQYADRAIALLSPLL